ncbi:MAG: hypothetical protein ABF649_21995 [Bacillus sp. (in: firmicutes)]
MPPFLVKYIKNILLRDKIKTIAYYISDYGYGHASRSIAIIRELLKVDNDYGHVILPPLPCFSPVFANEFTTQCKFVGSCVWGLTPKKNTCLFGEDKNRE